MHAINPIRLALLISESAEWMLVSPIVYDSGKIFMKEV